MRSENELTSQFNALAARLGSTDHPPAQRAVEDFLTLLTEEKNAFTRLAPKLSLDTVLALGNWLATHASSRQTRERDLAQAFLNLIRSPQLLKRVAAAGIGEPWFVMTLALIRSAELTVGRLFNQRVHEYGQKALFKQIAGRRVSSVTWQEAKNRVNAIAGALLEIQQGAKAPLRVAMYSENSLELVLFDLACLTTGIVNVPIPTNATAANVAYILRHSGCNLVFVSGDERLSAILGLRDYLGRPGQIIAAKVTEGPDRNFVSLEDVMTRGRAMPHAEIQNAVEAVRIGDLATIMYTSGTTELPKGIKFTQLNLVSKRFARAIALPKIGEKDRFLCYLPLFHTFGRYFEMLGSIFWGATYFFLENPKIETIISSMQTAKPTVFISIPKKWIQLYEHIASRVDVLRGNDAMIKAVVAEVTGGKLAWGLSAAGYLDPDIFRFFQHNGIEIMSGFGMTEATGGITMTPPKKYRPDSVGVALPGIDIELAEDGEMRIRGPYVTPGYLDQSDSGLRDGWLYTGDIFARDEEGYYRIIDRKKEIYKNVRGETIAPQKIENMFQDFESVKRVFLVGDHREFNTLLLFPNYDYEQMDLRALSSAELHDFFSSLLVPVNQFLAPYERIVNFEVIDRDFSEDFGELTAKGTYKRKAIESNFKDLIARLYEAEHLPFTADGLEIRIPTWFLRETGLTRNDVKLRKSGLLLLPSGARLTVRVQPERSCCSVRIGDFHYRTKQPFVDLGFLLKNPELWLGNLALQRFSQGVVFRNYRSQESPKIDLELQNEKKPSRMDKKYAEQFSNIVALQDRSETGVHLAARVVFAGSEKAAVEAISYLESVIQERNEETLELAKTALMRAARSDKPRLKKLAFQVLVLNENRDLLRPILENFLEAKPAVLDEETISLLSEQDLSKSQLDSIITYLNSFKGLQPSRASSRANLPVVPLLRLLTAYGLNHPLSFKLLRTQLVRWALTSRNKTTARVALQCAHELQAGFRNWLGRNLQITIDPESMSEFRWRDVLVFEEGILDDHRKRISAAIQDCPLIREGLFLFSGGQLIQLQDIPKNGVWISFLGARHGKSVYRISVQTHLHGAFDLAVNVNTSLSRKDVQDETNWLVGVGSTDERPLVEDFGGYWPAYDLWTEEFIPGDTVEKYLMRLDRRAQDGGEGIVQLWPSFVWSGLSAYIDFWNRTGRQQVVADPTPANVIVPTHDFQIGFRIVSISERKPFEGIPEMLIAFKQQFINTMESKYKKLAGKCGWNIVFSAFLETLGEAEGLRVLTREALPSLRRRSRNKEIKTIVTELNSFVRDVEMKGYRSSRLHFAIRRFRRWHTLNPSATPQACIQTMRDLYTTYTLNQTEEVYPGTRIQFFRDTVFIHSERRLRQRLNAIIQKVRTENLTVDDLLTDFADLREKCKLSEPEEIFLTRLTYPHLGAHDSAEFVSLTSLGTAMAALVVYVEDKEGYQFAIRHPVSPKEIARLHKLFTLANLAVDFRPDHQFLLILNDKSHVIGGLFYRNAKPGHVHLEKVVVDGHYRRKGISDGLLNDFFNRLMSQAIEIVTVGFLRPQFFYKFGFQIDHRYGNMVKKLKPDAEIETIDLTVDPLK